MSAAWVPVEGSSAQGRAERRARVYEAADAGASSHHARQLRDLGAELLVHVQAKVTGLLSQGIHRARGILGTRLASLSLRSSREEGVDPTVPLRCSRRQSSPGDPGSTSDGSPTGRRSARSIDTPDVGIENGARIVDRCERFSFKSPSMRGKLARNTSLRHETGRASDASCLPPSSTSYAS